MSEQRYTPLTIREHAGLPVLQHFVQILSKLLVAHVTEQVIRPAFGMKVLQKVKNNTHI